MKTFGEILGYGVSALCILAGLGGDHLALVVGVAILLAMLLSTDTWGLRTRIVLARMSPQERASARVRLAVQAQDARAARALQAQQKAQAKRVAAAEKALAAAEAGPSRRLGAYQGKTGRITLFVNRIETPQGTAYFGEGPVEATVDTAGNLSVTKRATLTRMAAGTVLLGPIGLIGGGMLKKTQKFDTRELYLMIEAPRFVTTVACKPNDGARVRDFAAKVRTASRSFPTQEQRARAVQAAQAQLEAARATPQS